MAKSEPQPPSIDGLLSAMPTPDEQAQAQAAAQAAVKAARDAGLAAIRSFVATKEYQDVMTVAKQLQSYMGGDPIAGPHINCLAQVMPTLGNAVANVG